MERDLHDREDFEADDPWWGRVVILRVRIAEVVDQIEPGEEREFEWRLKGCVEGVEIDEEDDDDSV